MKNTIRDFLDMQQQKLLLYGIELGDDEQEYYLNVLEQKRNGDHEFLKIDGAQDLMYRKLAFEIKKEYLFGLYADLLRIEEQN